MHQDLQKSVVCFGEILWDVLPTGSRAGGAPMNVAYHLKKLNVDPLLITKVGLDDYGRKLIDLMADAGIDTEYFQMDASLGTGIVQAKTNEFHDTLYDITYPVAWDFIEVEEEVKKWVEASSYFVFGSLIARHHISRNTLYEFLEMASNRVLDINLRSPYFNKETVSELLSKAQIAKLNISELELITGWFGNSKTTNERIQSIQDQFHIETIIVTKAAQGATVNYKGEYFEHGGFKVPVADTVGSGDAFLAAFINSLLKKQSMVEALSNASILGAFIATQVGACPEYEPSDVKRFYSSHCSKITDK